MSWQLIDLLDNITLGDEAADAFNIITLDKSMNVLPVVRPLYKQKLYHTFSGRLLKGNASSLVGAQLRAFAYILRMVPYQVLNLNIEKVCIECPCVLSETLNPLSCLHRSVRYSSSASITMTRFSFRLQSKRSTGTWPANTNTSGRISSIWSTAT